MKMVFLFPSNQMTQRIFKRTNAQGDVTSVTIQRIVVDSNGYGVVYEQTTDQSGKAFYTRNNASIWNMFGLMSLEEQMLFRNSFILIACSTAILSCSKGYLNTENQIFKIVGNAQGTTYTIQVVDSSLTFLNFKLILFYLLSMKSYLTTRLIH